MPSFRINGINPPTENIFRKELWRYTARGLYIGPRQGAHGQSHRHTKHFSSICHLLVLRQWEPSGVGGGLIFVLFELARARYDRFSTSPIRCRCNNDSILELENPIAKIQEMTYTFLRGSRPLVCIHRYHHLVRIHFSLPVLELQPSVFWVTPPGCRDSKRWQVDRCRRVTASGEVIGLICYMARPASGLESRTSFPLCTYTWNRRETRRVWRLTATTSTCIAYVNLPSV